MARLHLAALDARLTPAGGLDLSWGTDGVATLPDTTVPTYQAFALTADGGAVAGRADKLVRLGADGRLLAGFGGSGTGVTPVANFALLSLAVGPGDTVYAVGDAGTSGRLVRLTADGRPDAGFGTGGVVDLGTDSVSSLAVRPDGGVVLGLTAGLPGGPDAGAPPRVAVVSPDGRSVRRFAVPLPGGNTILSNPGAARVAATPDGGLLAVVPLTQLSADGQYLNTTRVVKLTAAGGLDASYGTGGVLDLSDADVFPTADGGATVLLSGIETYGPDERGLSSRASKPVGLARLTPAGQVDAAYAGDGAAELGLPADANALAVYTVPLPDGRTLTFALRVTPTTTRTVYARVFAADGSPDATVADGGWLALGLDRVGVEGPYDGVAGGGDRVLIRGLRTGFVDGVYQATTGTAVLDLSAPTPAGATVPATAQAPVAPPVVRAEAPASGQQPVREVLAPTATRVAGDYDGDGTADRVQTDGPRVSVVSGKDGGVLVPGFAPFEASYAGPLNAVLADFDGDGRSELAVSPDQGGGPVVAVYAAGRPVARFFGIEDAGFRGGVRLAGGDLDGDGAADLVVSAGDGGGPRVAVFDGPSLTGRLRRLVNDFYAFEEGQRGGAYVAVPADGGEMIFGAGPGGAPRVRIAAFADLRATAARSLDDLPAERTVDKYLGDPAARAGARVAIQSYPHGAYAVVADLGDGKLVSADYGRSVGPQSRSVAFDTPELLGVAVG